MANGLSREQRDRYARHLALPDVGEDGQLSLLKSSVLVVGAGGLGSPAILYLAAAGVGRIGVIDFDSVSLSNLQRQVIHSTGSIGESKVGSAAKRISGLNPDVEVIEIEQRLTNENAIGVIENFDLVIDGTDNFETRYLIGDACEALGKPWVFGSIHRFDGQVSSFNYNNGPNYRDLFPEPPPAELAPNCAEAGGLGVLPGIVGTIQATEAIKMILGVGEILSGKLLTIDARNMEMRALSFKSDSTRKRASLVDIEQKTRFSEISPLEFVNRSKEGWSPFLLDVRRSDEEEIVKLEGTDLRIQHLQVHTRLDEIPKDQEVVIYCRVGGRSAAVARFLVESGWSSGNVYNLSGGIHEWSDTVDSSIIKY